MCVCVCVCLAMLSMCGQNRTGTQMSKCLKLQDRPEPQSVLASSLLRSSLVGSHSPPIFHHLPGLKDFRFSESPKQRSSAQLFLHILGHCLSSSMLAQSSKTSRLLNMHTVTIFSDQHFMATFSFNGQVVLRILGLSWQEPCNPSSLPLNWTQVDNQLMRKTKITE